MASFIGTLGVDRLVLDFLEWRDFRVLDDVGSEGDAANHYKRGEVEKQL